MQIEQGAAGKIQVKLHWVLHLDPVVYIAGGDEKYSDKRIKRLTETGQIKTNEKAMGEKSEKPPYGS